MTALPRKRNIMGKSIATTNCRTKIRLMASRPTPRRTTRWNLSDSDIEALATFYASQRPQTKK